MKETCLEFAEKEEAAKIHSQKRVRKRKKNLRCAHTEYNRAATYQPTHVA